MPPAPQPAPVPEPTAPDAAYRLPRTVEPLAYRLVLEPDLEAATFTGTEEVELLVVEATSRIVCNAADLSISGAVVLGAEGTEQPATVELDPDAERATFTLPEPLGPGPCTLRCRFDGVLNDELRGFYRSTFTDDDGVKRTIATSQMEATDARRAFPCWDEPDRKAVFEVTLVVPDGQGAFSNSPVRESVDLGDGRRAVHFAPTMKMSTYLVALIVGPLEATDAVDVDGVPVRVVHAPGKAHLSGFAHDIAAHALRFFTTYFDIAYPGDKLDLLAIPDFAFGAMENLGCVTFRETALLVDPATAARVDLERVADVVSHEIAHMWFGDLVTMRWWEGIWLNEAFATLMETLCVDAYRPDWERWVSFAEEREMALAVDGLHSTRPIEYPVGSPQEADGMFDVLTYQKGGSVLRMLEQFLGADTFRDGVRRYLRRHAYANTVTGDLWRALEEESGLPVGEVMDSWILQGGHPLVSLSDGTLSQQPFAYAPASADDESAIGSTWRVPVQLRDLAEPAGDEQRVLLGPDALALDRPAGNTTVVNAGGWGVYRVRYDGQAMAGLASRMADLRPLERVDLFSDTWAGVLAGQTGLDVFLRLAASLGDDPEPGTWRSVAGALDLCDRVAAEDDRPRLAAATRVLMERRSAELGWEAQAGDSGRTPTLRALLIATLGTTGEHEPTRAEAARRFADAPAGGGSVPIPADIEGAVLDVVATANRAEDYAAMLERYRNAPTPQDEHRYLFALAGFPDVDRALETLQLALTEVRTQDTPYLVAQLVANRVAGPAVWAGVTREWDRLLSRIPANSDSRMVSPVRLLCGDADLAAGVRRFLAGHPVRTGERRVRQSLERLDVNVEFGRRQRDGLAAALRTVTGGAGS